MADRFQEPLPEWENAGTKPADEVIDAGWQIGDKPPASWWNWLSNRVYKCLEELRQYITDKEANKMNIPLYITTGTNTNYIVTSDPPAETAENGMIFFIRAHTENVAQTRMSLDGVINGARVRRLDGSTIASGDIRQSYTYMVMVYNSEFYLLDFKQALLPPLVKTQRLNMILNQGLFLVRGNPDMPPAISSTESCLLEVNIYTGSGTNYSRQTLTELSSGQQYIRDITSNAIVVNDWKLSQWTDSKNQVRSTQLFQNYSCRGLDISVSASSYTITVGDGVIYNNDTGMAYNDGLKTITDSNPGNDGDIKYLVINTKTNILDIVSSGGENQLEFAELQVGPTGFTGYTRLFSGYKLVPYVEAETPPSDDVSEKIANTQWVKNYVDSQGGGGAGKVYFVAVCGTTAAGYTENDVDFLCDGTNDADQIQSALRTTPAGWVKLLPGSYVLNHSIEIPIGAGLYGDNYASNVRLIRAYQMSGINTSFLRFTGYSQTTYTLPWNAMYGVELAMQTNYADVGAHTMLFQAGTNARINITNVRMQAVVDLAADTAIVATLQNIVELDACAFTARGPASAVQLSGANGVLVARNTFLAGDTTYAPIIDLTQNFGGILQLYNCKVLGGSSTVSANFPAIRIKQMGTRSNYYSNIIEDTTVTASGGAILFDVETRYFTSIISFRNSFLGGGITANSALAGNFIPRWRFDNCEITQNYATGIGVDLTNALSENYQVNDENYNTIFNLCRFVLCSTADVAFNSTYPRPVAQKAGAVVFIGCSGNRVSSAGGNSVMYQANPNLRLMAVNNDGWAISGTVTAPSVIANNF